MEIKTEMTNHLERIVRTLQVETKVTEPECGAQKNTNTLIPFIRKPANTKSIKLKKPEKEY